MRRWVARWKAMESIKVITTPEVIAEAIYMASPTSREFERQQLLAIHGHDGDEVGHPGPSASQSFKDIGRTGRIVR